MDINNIVKIADIYYEATITKSAKIRKLPDGRYRVLSQKGKNLGTYKSRSAAKKRLQQVEYFKHQDKNEANDNIIDLTDADDFVYSAIMRKLREKASSEQVLVFMTLFKKEFDKALKKKLTRPDKIALQNSLIKFNKLHPIKLKKKLVKNAAISELGNPTLVGRYLADIARFTLAKIPEAKRPKSIERLKYKIYNLNAGEISTKHLPSSASIGQSITFIKHVLFNHDPIYIRQVLNNIVRFL